MTANVYHKLREQLDQYSIGFPTTASGIEFKLMEKLFTEDEADMYLNLSLILEAPATVADRSGREVHDVAQILERMAQKGLLFRFRRGEEVRYAAAPFVVGSYEYQVGHMDREFAGLVEAYFEEALLPNIVNNVTPLRTVPVNKSVDVVHRVAPYEDAKEIIKTKKRIVVADCICRKQQKLVDKGCDKPLEVCLLFGSHATYYVENKMARFIDQSEALAILDQCEEAGLVNQPANMINPGGMCNCCGECCGVLRGLNKLPKPSEMVFNNYYARVDAEECNGCETCQDRCQMAAVSMGDEETAVVNPDRCIGCGLCVTTCPTGAIGLALKPEEHRRTPPSDGRKLMALTAEVRGTSLMPLYMTQK